MKPCNRWRITGCLLVSVIFLYAACFAAAADHAVILQYHHFGSDTPPSTSVTMEQFDNHLAYLDKNKFVVWPLNRIVSHLQEKKELPEKCVAITIDDAYRSVYERAFPRIQKYGWPFTVFVTTQGVDKGFADYMTWEQMREMAKKGVTFAGHSHTHSYLRLHNKGESETKWQDRVTRDILASFERIKAEIGQDSRLFAYPYGEYNNKLKKIILDLELVGFGQQSGAVWSGGDFGTLPRFPMSAGYAQMGEFKTKVNSRPLPVISSEPDDPELPENVDKPVLRLTISHGDYLKDTLTCYLSGQGPIRLKWIDRDSGIVEAVSDKPLPKGRSRYNFTARHRSGPGYFWYSHLWIRD
ncbi:MAG: polysaccharide deacetylase family protein [Syntrophales bacterium]|nr:polysaccharide deacetylase family protein [Syntrophales bacterium]